MSTAMRVALFTIPLVIFALLGALYTPTQPESDDISLSSLPPLPAWANDPLPDFSIYTDIDEKKTAFFDYLYPRIVLANARVLIQRQHLMELAEKESLTESETHWLEQQAKRLRVSADMGSQEMFKMLARRLDVIPPSLILAQAANESAWGTSRFALKGNNLFGQWCFSEGCGVVPNSRNEGASHEVASFESPYHSVRSYIQNLNRHQTYLPLRNTREQRRNQGKPLSGTALAQGLIGYSERGVEYVDEIRSMIRFNNLAYYDKQYRSQVQDNIDGAQLLELVTNKETALAPAARGEG
ncbi:glucosaminidase domain-containing protein [Marinobacter salicampi]|uniref:glucosaminidase domain-containing protein n=1 Tax=Marinobacter salicampi TaxID=435907 RepID=UPI001409E27C|nr:glucosaminidase domain-containing protein [Marinobacter salicampi]